MNNDMKNMEILEVKNPSERLLDAVRKLGLDKYSRQEKQRMDWNNGNYSEKEVIRL